MAKRHFTRKLRECYKKTLLLMGKALIDFAPKTNLDDEILSADFKRRVIQIKEINSRNLCEKYAREIVKETLEKDNYLISINQAMPYALERMAKKMEAGEIDYFYREIKDEEVQA